MAFERCFNCCNTDRTRYGSDWFRYYWPSLRYLSISNNSCFPDNSQRRNPKETLCASLGWLMRRRCRGVIPIVRSYITNSIGVDGMAFRSVLDALRLAPRGSSDIQSANSLVSIAGTPTDAFQHLRVSLVLPFA